MGMIMKLSYVYRYWLRAMHKQVRSGTLAVMCVIPHQTKILARSTLPWSITFRAEYNLGLPQQRNKLQPVGLP